jgi:hypothetical protein
MHCCIRRRHSTIPKTSSTIPISPLHEKRAVLASWASDACAVEDTPALRRAPGGRREVSVDDILEALRPLDRDATGAGGTSWARRQVRQRSIDVFRQRRARRDPGSARGLPH